MPGRYQHLAGRVVSGQEVFQISRDPSDGVRWLSNLAGWDGLP